MFNFRDLCRALRVAVASFSLLVAISLSAAGQTPADSGTHKSLMNRLAARDELNKGVKAFKSAHYDEAIAHFQRATEDDPGLLLAKQYLGVTLAQNVVPGLDTPENMKIAQRAIDLFQEVLAKDPHDVNSMKQIAGIDFSINELDDARIWQKKVLAEDPKDPEAAYTVGVIDWMEAHQSTLAALALAGLSDDGEGNSNAPAELMKTIKAQNGALVEEGIQYLKQAIENRPNYDDAMAYLNLIYRRKADLDWGNEATRKDDIAEAEQWRTKAMETRKANEEKRIAGPDSSQP
jgi:tetratricopeptide (TPR) repeat protein